MAPARRQRPRRSLLFAAVATAAYGALGSQSFAAPLSAAGRRATSSRMQLQASSQEDDERLDFIKSPAGQAITWLAKALADSPLNDGKIWMAKMQAGEYDEMAVQKELDGLLSDNKVMMFSISK
ncbi:unnamed protein product [Polarella glacialis]|uniref:Uncharacterized protein n=1 Tax=Polarella glacialis TaxID=89957 RepID=A0A813FII5_POLGL|nr:unnamed protein product [Polarella glacialis]CAE8738245.1 unnamed protein product [Polarella glacialis]|mmetsp:Transcript_71819/g.129305  ORF Transcript_71819/g.129305 Transcript_71819/m.129305 type:complete len:124 (+) Transcript_71819:55-426(+)